MTTIVPPKKLAIYYGFPSGVNGTFSVAGAANVFKDYDLVVFGDGLQDPGHPDHQNTEDIIAHPDMSSTNVYGYIDSTLTLNDIQNKIDQWYDMGIAGIFLDQFGYDFGVAREKQREIVWCVHEKGAGLKAFVNAWNPDDAFSPAVDATYNPSGLDTRLGADDYYLAESFAIKLGQYDDDDLDTNGIKDFQDKSDKMINYRTTYGTKLAAITTNDDPVVDSTIPFDQAKADYSYLLSVMNELDAWGWGEPTFSASGDANSQLPLRTRASYDGTKFTGALIKNAVNGVIERDTNVGIHIDTNAHTVSNLLD